MLLKSLMPSYYSPLSSANATVLFPLIKTHDYHQYQHFDFVAQLLEDKVACTLVDPVICLTMKIGLNQFFKDGYKQAVLSADLKLMYYFMF